MVEAARTTQRIQTSLLSGPERRLLDWLCDRMPAWATPDRLTAFGMVGAFVVAAGYVGSNWSPGFLWLASLGFVLHWFGDSLDGSLARRRRIERPRYGYFVDHSTDALCNLAILAGLGASPYVRMDVALLLLVGYLLLSIFVFLKNHVSGRFELTFLFCGPTELRLCLIALNAAMIVTGPAVLRGTEPVLTVYDAVFLAAAALFIALFALQVATVSAQLRRTDSAPGPS